MKPVELFDICVDAVNRWNVREQITDVPTVMLVIPRLVCPKGDSIRLLGKSGPLGRIATVKETESGFDVVAYFPALPILALLQREVG